ncbi:M23 family metallopeptidase [Colwellia sp. E2M01]|nr:M23 family metallopeptidase [Colwellia sp. E2M01]
MCRGWNSLLLLMLMASITHCYAGQLYKYKDVNGGWVFSDKPPETEDDFETLAFSKDKKSTSKVKLKYTIDTDGYRLQAHNKFYAPVEVEIVNPETQISISKVVPAQGEIDLFTLKNKTSQLKFRWAMGDPNLKPDNYPYQPPFDSPKGHQITQGFNGKFSHTSEYSRYAVDIAMDVGTYLTAVRAGTVVWVKDDYHMSGTTTYFLDKANVIRVLHDDGTFASYAHILMDTALVKAGDKVAVGDKLARSGSSGFSTGPHLHFSIIRNIGLKNVSIPFKFVNPDGETYTPKRTMFMVGSVKP